MTPAIHSTTDVEPALTSPVCPEPSPRASAPNEAQLREHLKRCSLETAEAACAFRQSSDFALLPVIVRGVIGRFTGREHRDRLTHASAAELHLAADLGLDSLTMMEIVMLAEDVFPISINNDELRGLRTVGDVQHFIECKLRGMPPPTPAACSCVAAAVPSSAGPAATAPAHVAG